MNILEYALAKKMFGGTGSGGSDTPSGDMICTLVDPVNIGISAFRDCTELTSINLPNATIIQSEAFDNCTALTSIDLPNTTSIDSNAFDYCTALMSINLPNATIIQSHAFDNCTALTSIDLPNATSIESNAFDYCLSFDTLILRNTETVCQINATAVMGTKIMTAEGMPTGKGFVYVPTALYEQYVSNLAAQVMEGGYDEATATYLVTIVLRKIEDYPEICG